MSTGNNVITYTGDGFSGIYIWGAQLEVGAFSTSYIPTVASQVTRAADVAVMTGTNFSSWYRQSEGTVYAEFVNGIPGGASASNQNAGVWSAADSSLGATFNGYGVRLVANLSNNNAIMFTGRSGATVLNAGTTAIGFPAAGTTYKTASAWSATELVFALSGAAGSPIANTVASLLTMQDVFRLGTQSVGGSPPYALNGHIRRIAYYPIRIQNNQLQALTS
jgi:hypothetical protein